MAEVFAGTSVVVIDMFARTADRRQLDHQQELNALFVSRLMVRHGKDRVKRLASGTWSTRLAATSAFSDRDER